MIDTFLTSGNNINKFLKAFHEKRTLAHLRPVKVMISVSSLLEKYHEKRKLTSFARFKVVPVGFLNIFFSSAIISY